MALLGFPLVLGIWYSLTNTTVVRDGTFIGLKNFVDALKDPTFILAMRNTLIIAVVATAAKITLSVGLAFLLLGAFRGRSLLRTLFVLPWTIPVALSTIAWKWMFHSVQRRELDAGARLRHRPRHPVAWHASAGDVRGNLGEHLARRAVRSRRRHGWPHGLPAEVVDAARVDGANWWQRSRVIVPLMAPILFIAILFDLIFTLTELTVVFLLTGGGRSTRRRSWPITRCRLACPAASSAWARRSPVHAARAANSDNPGAPHHRQRESMA